MIGALLSVQKTFQFSDQFLSWYKRFGQMWHPKENDTDYIRIQPLNVQKAKSTFRITMRLQPGKRDNATTFDFDFKVTIDVVGSLLSVYLSTTKYPISEPTRRPQSVYNSSGSAL